VENSIFISLQIRGKKGSKLESISWAFYNQLLHQYSFDKKLHSQIESKEKLLKTIFVKKACVKY